MVVFQSDIPRREWVNTALTDEETREAGVAAGERQRQSTGGVRDVDRCAGERGK